MKKLNHKSQRIEIGILEKEYNNKTKIHTLKIVTHGGMSEGDCITNATYVTGKVNSSVELTKIISSKKSKGVWNDGILQVAKFKKVN